MAQPCVAFSRSEVAAETIDRAKGGDRGRYEVRHSCMHLAVNASSVFGPLKRFVCKQQISRQEGSCWQYRHWAKSRAERSVAAVHAIMCGDRQGNAERAAIGPVVTRHMCSRLARRRSASHTRTISVFLLVDSRH